MTENKLPELIPEPHSSPYKYNDFDEEVSESELLQSEALIRQLRFAEEHNVDYIEVVSSCSCATCAKYRNRIYCLSGNDIRFPRVPDYILKYSYHCRLFVYPFFLGSNYVHTSDGQAVSDVHTLIKISNRPFVDDRADEEIGRYNTLWHRRKQDYIDSINRKRSAAEYEIIERMLPEFAPKGKGAYLRMKQLRSDNYIKIMRVAEMSNIKIRPLFAYDTLIQDQINDAFYEYHPSFAAVGDVTTATWSAQSRSYRVRWSARNEQKLKFDVTIYDGKHRKMQFCNCAEEAIKICQ